MLLICKVLFWLVLSSSCSCRSEKLLVFCDFWPIILHHVCFYFLVPNHHSLWNQSDAFLCAWCCQYPSTSTMSRSNSYLLYGGLIFAEPYSQRQTLGVDMGPPGWGLHRIILFFLYSSSLLCSEPTHVFGRTRWLTLANGNQKTRVKVTWLSHTPTLEVLHPAPRSIPFSLETSPRCVKKLYSSMAYLRLEHH